MSGSQLHVPFSIRHCCLQPSTHCVYVRNTCWRPLSLNLRALAFPSLPYSSPCPYLVSPQLMCDMSNEIGHFFNGNGGIWHLDSCPAQGDEWDDLQKLTSEAKLGAHSRAVCRPLDPPRGNTNTLFNMPDFTKTTQAHCKEQGPAAVH